MTETAFGNWATESSQAFRTILKAMSQPGQVQSFAPAIEAPQPFLASTSAVALTLCDYQTPVWLSPSLCSAETKTYLRFHTNAPVVADRAAASFAFMSAAEAEADFSGFHLGTAEYPDRSATLVIQSDDLSSGHHFSGRGPGVKDMVTFQISGLGQQFSRAALTNHNAYPLGLDFIFTGPGCVLALPRSFKLHEAEMA